MAAAEEAEPKVDLESPKYKGVIGVRTMVSFPANELL
jgi:hypothetical protein